MTAARLDPGRAAVARDAAAAWRVTLETNVPVYARYVEAEADTGSRYAVATALIPFEAGSREGGQVLVAVLAPWRACYPFAVDGGYLHVRYVAEKLCRPTSGELNLGDLVALTLTLAHALGRDADPLADLGVSPTEAGDR